MLKKLNQIGGSWCVIIPKTVLEMLNINPILDKIEFLFNGDEIIIRKHKKIN